MKFSLRNGDGVTVVGPHLDLADKDRGSKYANRFGPDWEVQISKQIWSPHVFVERFKKFQYDMIQCDLCNKWLHMRCEELQAPTRRLTDRECRPPSPYFKRFKEQCFS